MLTETNSSINKDLLHFPGEQHLVNWYHFRDPIRPISHPNTLILRTGSDVERVDFCQQHQRNLQLWTLYHLRWMHKKEWRRTSLMWISTFPGLTNHHQGKIRFQFINDYEFLIYFVGFRSGVTLRTSSARLPEIPAGNKKNPLLARNGTRYCQFAYCCGKKFQTKCLL